MIIDSNSTLGNIGYPAGYDGAKHIRKMLNATRSLISDEEVEGLVVSLAEK